MGNYPTKSTTVTTNNSQPVLLGNVYAGRACYPVYVRKYQLDDPEAKFDAWSNALREARIAENSVYRLDVDFTHVSKIINNDYTSTQVNLTLSAIQNHVTYGGSFTNYIEVVVYYPHKHGTTDRANIWADFFKRKIQAVMQNYTFNFTINESDRMFHLYSQETADSLLALKEK